MTHSQKFRLNRSWVLSEGPFKFVTATWGMFAAALVCSWVWGVEDRYKLSLRHFLNEKLLKYVPIENGGQMLFPFTFLLTLGLRVYPRTQ